MNDRLDELESRTAFQDHAIQELSDVIANQDKQLLVMRKEIDALKKFLKNMNPSNLASQDEETPPPHY